MSELDYAMEPEVECVDNDPNDAAFVQATRTVGGRDAVKEYVTCKMYPLDTSFFFESVAFGMTPMSKVETAWPLFTVGAVDAEHAEHFLVEIETEAKRILESFEPKEYDTLMVANIPNGSRLKWVFEQMGVSYAPCPVLGSDASQEAVRKWKAEVLKKPIMKKVKVGLGRATPSKMTPPLSQPGPSKRARIIKMAQPKTKPERQGTSEIELSLAKPVGVSKKFCLLDVATSSQRLPSRGLTMVRVERPAHVPAFDNLGDDSLPDVHKARSPERTVEKCTSPPPSMAGEFFSF
jgi:hypothetical protein